MRLLLAALLALALAPAAQAAQNPNSGSARTAPAPGAKAFAPPAASALAAEIDPNTFGPPPTRCSEIVGAEGCWADWPNSLPDTYVGGFAIADHTLKVNEVLRMTAWGYCCAAAWEWNGACAPNTTFCNIQMTAPTTGWAKFSMPFKNNIGPALEEDYYAVVGAEWISIEGFLKRRAPAQPGKLVPAVGVPVSVTGPIGTRTSETTPEGKYTLWTKRGENTVAPDSSRSKYCLSESVSTGCTQTTTRDLQADVFIDWTQAPYHNVSGTVLSQDGKGIEHAPIRIRPAAGAAGPIVSGKSGPGGKYLLEAQEGAIEVLSGDPTLCVVGVPAVGGKCGRVKAIDLKADAVVDFERTGCDTTVDFGGRMVAKGDCFKVDEADKKWHTDEPFWMNGLRIHPKGEVKFDRIAQTISSGANADYFLHLPDKSEVLLMRDVPLSLDFSSLAKEILPGELNTDNSGKLGGLVLDGGGKLEWGAGTTTLELSITASKQAYSFLQGKDAKEEPVKITLRGIAENEVGLRRLEGSFAKDIQLPPRGSLNGKKYVTLKEVSGAYDFKTPDPTWRMGAKVEAAFLRGGAAQDIFGAGVIGVPLVEGTLDISGVDFLPKYLSVSVDPLNKPLPWGLFLQRLAFAAGVNDLAEGPAPLAMKVGARVSVGPSFDQSVGSVLPIKFKEVAAVEADFTISDADRGLGTLGDVALVGEGTMKLFDYPFIGGGISIFPGQASVVVDGNAKLEIPIAFKGIDGGIFGISGTASAWFDGINNEFAGSGTGIWSMGPLGRLGARWVGSKQSMAACITDTKQEWVDVGGGVQVPGATTTTDLYGIVYDWNSGNAKIIGCDLGPYTKTKPTATRSQAGARAQRFTVPKGVRTLGVEVTADGPVQVKGPSGTAKLDPARPAKTPWLVAIPSATGGQYTLALTKAKPGRYTVTGAKGLRFASPVPEPEIALTVGEGCAPKISWKAKRIPGQEIRLLDVGEQSVRVLTRSAKASGSVKTGTATAGRRTIVAQFLQGGVERTAVIAGSYDAMAGGLPAAPAGVRVAGNKLSWKPACGAAAYAVAFGKGKPATVKGTSLKLSKAARRAKQVTITSLTASGAAGGAVTRTLKVSAG